MDLMVIGCDGTYPSANGACSGYLVRAGEARILMDCGSGVMSKLMSLMDPARLSAVILTHWHNDHASDMLVLRYYLQIHKRKLDVYAPLEQHPLMRLCEGSEFILRDIRELTEIDGIRIETLPVSHPVAAYAVRISYEEKALVYTGDTNRWESLVGFCKEADALICDATFHTDEWHDRLPHLTAAQAAELGKQAAVKRLILTHFQPGSDAQSLTREAQAVYHASEPAKPGIWLHL